ncbi:hypothetical protein Tco_0908754 [Tanacetum coccineum]|uniref:Uncharacterized protein n=1 Tax=Tanacetum coccineum TaxID=301880 RepID=A0ABQ5CUK3_9ASTR
MQNTFPIRVYQNDQKSKKLMEQYVADQKKVALSQNNSSNEKQNEWEQQQTFTPYYDHSDIKREGRALRNLQVDVIIAGLPALDSTDSESF